MKLPFTTEQFLEVFRQYNLAIYPLQIVFYLLAIAVLVRAARPRATSGRFVSLALAVLWLWMGVAYHWGYFAAINPAAYVFGGVFVLQSVLLLVFGWFRPNLEFVPRRDVYGVAGGVLMVYALLVYPMLGALGGHGYPAAPTFGLPCPTTIFTLGMLLWHRDRAPFAVLAIPIVWSVIGFTAAFKLGIYEDIGLLVAALTTVALWLWRGVGERRGGQAVLGT